MRSATTARADQPKILEVTRPCKWIKQKSAAPDAILERSGRFSAKKTDMISTRLARKKRARGYCPDGVRRPCQASRT
jgi:hypothetical protein